MSSMSASYDALTGRALSLGAVGVGRARKSGPLRVCALPRAPSADIAHRARHGRSAPPRSLTLDDR